MGARKGFTLVETLVAIAVIAILLGILIPVLRQAIGRSKAVNDLVNLRSTHQQFYEWGVDHDNFFLNVGPPSDDGSVTIGAGEGNGFVVGPYTLQSSYWPLILAASGLPGVASWHSSLDVIPENPDYLGRAVEGGRYVRKSTFLYSQNLITAPGRWVSPSCAESQTNLARFNVFVRWDQPSYPAEKGFMIDSAEPKSPSTVRPVSFVDGSSGTHDLAAWIGSSQPDCPQGYFEPVVKAPFGYLGRDFSR